MADPVADFLAREHDMLAELEGEAPPPVNNPELSHEHSPNSSDRHSDGFEIVDSETVDVADDFGNMQVADADPAPVPAAQNANFFEDENAFPNNDSGVDLAAMDAAFGGQPAAVPAYNNGRDGSSPMMNGSSGPSPVPSFPKIEAENIRKWREQQREMLEKKDIDEEKKKEDWRAQAKKDLQDWYTQKDAALVKTKDNNKKMEADYADQREREQGSDAAWDEIAKLCDAKPKAGTKDVGRMKSLLLILKEHQNK